METWELIISSVKDGNSSQLVVTILWPDILSLFIAELPHGLSLSRTTYNLINWINSDCLLEWWETEILKYHFGFCLDLLRVFIRPAGTARLWVLTGLSQIQVCLDNKLVDFKYLPTYQSFCWIALACRQFERSVSMTALVLRYLEYEDTILFRNVCNYVSIFPRNITLLDPEEEGNSILRNVFCFWQVDKA